MHSPRAQLLLLTNIHGTGTGSIVNKMLVFSPLLTISCDHWFVQLIFVIFTEVSHCRGDHSSGISHTTLEKLDFSLEEHPFCLLACGPSPSCGSLQELWKSSLQGSPAQGWSQSVPGCREVHLAVNSGRIKCSVAPWKSGSSRVVYLKPFTNKTFNLK